MKAVAQKQISDFFNTKPKKHAKIIFKVTNETEDNEEVICLNGPKESEKKKKKPVGRPKRERNKGDYGSTVQLVIYRI